MIRMDASKPKVVSNIVVSLKMVKDKDRERLRQRMEFWKVISRKMRSMGRVNSDGKTGKSTKAVSENQCSMEKGK
jgi:cyclophilin family peptidyl-prolyl cis-trans isomerase